MILQIRAILEHIVTANSGLNQLVTNYCILVFYFRAKPSSESPPELMASKPLVDNPPTLFVLIPPAQ